MKKLFKILLPLLALVLLAVFVLRPSQPSEVQQEPTSEQEIIQEMVQTYSRGGDPETVDALLAQLEETNAAAAEQWRQIMTVWKSSGNHMILNLHNLPDGLDGSSKLCLIVLGYQLNPDGTMREELIGRLETALRAAKKYPQCRILCTGGGTASRSAEVTEADAMAQWLMEQGIPESRIIVENRSLTTIQNAVFSYEILSEQYPETEKLALISSDYHIPWAMVLFQTELILEGSPMRVISNAAYLTGQQLSDRSLLRYQASGILELANLS